MSQSIAFPDCPYRFTLTPHDSIVGESQHTHCAIDNYGTPVGSFIFNYHTGLDKIIRPFQIGEGWYTTYATSYNKLAVARLHPDRFEHIDADVGGKEGFCPVEVLVPFKLSDGTYSVWHVDPEAYNYEYFAEPGRTIEYADFGFVAGCVWGDDTTYKLRYLDFSKLATERKLSVTAPFGYFELPSTGVMHEYFNLEDLDEGVLRINRGEVFERRADGSWRDYSTRSHQQERAHLLRKLAVEVLGDKGMQWMFQNQSALNGMRPDSATCTVEGTVKAIQLLFKDRHGA